MADYTFELWQNGIMVASVDGPDLIRVRAEIMHYAAQYIEDGPLEIRGANVAALRHSPNPGGQGG